MDTTSSKKNSRSAHKEKANKQPGGKKKEKSPAAPKDKTKEKNLVADREKEEKKKEKLQKKKALDERDLNILGQLTQLNKSVLVIDEHGREVEEKEKELERKKLEIVRREKEVQRKEEVANKENHQNKGEGRKRDVLMDKLRCLVASPSNRNHDTEDDEDDYFSR